MQQNYNSHITLSFILLSLRVKSLQNNNVVHADGLVQKCGISIANALEIPQSSNKPINTPTHFAPLFPSDVHLSSVSNLSLILFPMKIRNSIQDDHLCITHSFYTFYCKTFIDKPTVITHNAHLYNSNHFNCYLIRQMPYKSVKSPSHTRHTFRKLRTLDILGTECVRHYRITDIFKL